MIPLSAEHRAAAGVQGGDEVEVSVRLDLEPRTVTLPADLEAALVVAGVLEAFEASAPSGRRRTFGRSRTPRRRRRANDASRRSSRSRHPGRRRPRPVAALLPWDGLGLPTEGIVGTEFEHGAVAFFDLEGGLRLALWPRASLAADTGLPVGAPSPTGFSLGHNVGSDRAVDEVMAAAAAAGATVLKPARPTFWGGYAGYLQDPDGHLWEIVHNPAWTPAAA
jgi:uncharacterized protein